MFPGDNLLPDDEEGDVPGDFGSPAGGGAGTLGAGAVTGDFGNGGDLD